MMIVVAAALTREDGRIFVQRRPLDKNYGGFWEFPGGKVNAGELPEAALARELAEELHIAVDVADLTPLAFATGPAIAPPLLLLLYRCTRWTGEPRLMEATALDWLVPEAMRALPMPPADEPLVELLVRLRRAVA